MGESSARSGAPGRRCWSVKSRRSTHLAAPIFLEEASSTSDTTSTTGGPCGLMAMLLVACASGASRALGASTAAETRQGTCRVGAAHRRPAAPSSPARLGAHEAQQQGEGLALHAAEAGERGAEGGGRGDRRLGEGPVAAVTPKLQLAALADAGQHPHQAHAALAVPHRLRVPAQQGVCAGRSLESSSSRTRAGARVGRRSAGVPLPAPLTGAACGAAARHSQHQQSRRCSCRRAGLQGGIGKKGRGQAVCERAVWVRAGGGRVGGGTAGRRPASTHR